MADDQFVNLPELVEAIETGLDIECTIYEQRYYIGWSNSRRIIALCPDGDGDFFDTLESMLDFNIADKPLRDIWQDIKILSM